MRIIPSLNDFVPNETAASQKDFVYARAKGNYKDDSDNPVNLVFKHALAEISIKAKNANADYKVQITGVQLGNIVSKASFKFPKLGGSDPEEWYGFTNAPKKDYTTTWTAPVTLTSEASSLDAANVPFMLIPFTTMWVYSIIFKSTNYEEKFIVYVWSCCYAPQLMRPGHH